MTLSIDASSPAVAISGNASQTVTNASFTPPAGSLLLVEWIGNTNVNDVPATPGITDSLGTPLTYTLIDHASITDVATADGQAAMWSAVVATSAPMTITVTNNTPTVGQYAAALKVTVITGADLASPIGASGVGGSTSAGAKTQNFTASRDGSWGFVAGQDWDVGGAETAGTGCTYTGGGTGNVFTTISYGFLLRSTPDGVAGATTAMAWTIPGASTNNSWVYAEVKPAASPATPQTIPPHLLYGLLLNRQQVADAAPAAVQASAEIGAAALGLTTSGTVVHVGRPAGAAPLAVATTGAARKVAPQSGNCAVGLTVRGVAARKQAQAGTAPLGLTAVGVDRKVAPQAGRAPLGVTAAGSTAKVARPQGSAPVGVATTGAAAKRATFAIAPVAVGLTTYNSTAIVPRAQTGTCAVGVAAYGTARRVAPGSGRVAVAVAPSGTAAKRAATAGVAALTTTPRTSAAVGHGAAGRVCVALSATATARKRGPGSAATGLGLTGTGRAVKRATPYGTADLLLVTAGATVTKRAVGRGAALVGLTASFDSATLPRQLAGRVLLALATWHKDRLVRRPNTGGVIRPMSGMVSRPGAGIVTRPASGVVIRPDTGTVARP